MKMKTILAGLAGLLLAACTEDLVEQKPSVTSSSSLRVEVIDNIAITRANYSGFPATTFEENDAIGVYAFDGSSYVVSNVRFVKQSDGSWTPDEEVPYNEDYTYYAYFPYRSTVYSPSTSGTVDDIDTKFGSFISDPSNYFWQANQSTKASFTKSNLMISKGTVTSTGDKSATIKFTMAHKRGLAIVTAANKWYYSDAAGTKYRASRVFSETNVPYAESGRLYYLVKPDVNTSAFGQTINLPAGEYKSCPIKLTGTPTYSYNVYHYGQPAPFSTSKPSWLTVTSNVVEGSPTEFTVTVTNSTSTTTSKGTGNIRDVAGDAALKAAVPVSNVDLSMVDNAGTTRASRTTANCYLVHAPGTYKIPLVYGNAIKNGDETSTTAFRASVSGSYVIQELVNHADVSITSPWIKTQLGSCPDGAQLIWEEVRGMISSVGIDTSGNGFLTFTVDDDNIAEGNAVVAATLDGTIVWSWHIWVTPETLSNLTTIDTGDHTYQLAPVNLGQVSGTIASGTTIYAGDLCRVMATSNGITVEFQVTAKDYLSGGTVCSYPSPYYQWGRKDPMYPGTGGYNSAGTFINSYSGTTLVKTDNITPGMTIQHPDYWCYNTSGGGVYYSQKFNWWDINQNNWSKNITTATVKTIYDPCPPDFCVPTSNLFYYAGNNSNQTVWQSTPMGRIWTINTTPIFFSATGNRTSTFGTYANPNTNLAYYHSATHYMGYSSMYLVFDSSRWRQSDSGSATGGVIRPVAEE